MDGWVDNSVRERLSDRTIIITAISKPQEGPSLLEGSKGRWVPLCAPKSLLSGGGIVTPTRRHVLQIEITKAT